MNSFERGGIGMTSQRTRDRLIQKLKERGIKDQRVLDVMRITPRHLFLDEALSSYAYEIDSISLPIGHNQTLSQPYIVARMTELLLSRGPLQKVLEVGTGSGYQTAILSQLVGRVYSVERIRPLHQKAANILRKLGYRNVTLSLSDGGFGWDRYAPYDAIISCAAPENVPESLLLQLAPDGILVLPVGEARNQELRIITRDGDSNDFDQTIVEAVNFVPLLSGISR